MRAAVNTRAAHTVWDRYPDPMVPCRLWAAENRAPALMAAGKYSWSGRCCAGGALVAAAQEALHDW